MKLLSRKLWITVANIATAILMKAHGKLSDEVFAIIMLTSSLMYIIMEGLIDIKSIKISKDELNVEIGKPNIDNNVKGGQDVDSK
jgi:hypothetical protein